MNGLRKFRLTRPLLAVVGATALIVVTAAPASAALPDDTDVSIEITDGQIRVNTRVFPLGPGDPMEPPDPCNPNDDPSTITATVGPIDVNGEATITNMDFEFQPALVAEAFGIDICATIVVTNDPGGTMTTQPSGDGAITIDGPGVELDVEIPIPFFAPNCRLDGLDVDLAGSITDGSSPWDAALANDPPGPPGFNVPDPTDCGSFADDVENAFDDGNPSTPPSDNLPSTDTEADFVLEVTAVP